MRNYIPFLLLILGLTSCSTTEKPDIQPARPAITLRFYHQAGTQGALKTDTLLYTDSLHQQYMVTDLQYIISRVAFHQCNGQWIFVTKDDGIHYTDVKIPSTLSWNTGVEMGCYDSVRFVFGLNEDDNISNRFPDPPLRDMFWPEVLGGGYHYMKMNLKWKMDTMMQLKPFMFHLGIGQVYAGNSTSTDSIIGFIQNHFTVTLPLQYHPDNPSHSIVMIVDGWMDGENHFDLSAYPMGIMQNQEGMYHALQNGNHSFTTIFYFQY